MAEAEVRLRVEELRKSFGEVEALKGVSLEVRSGEIFGLLGPNGAGKSTLIRIVAGLEFPDSGRVEIGGRERTRPRPEDKRGIAYVPQETALFEALSGRRNLLLFAELAGVPRPERADRADKALDEMGLSGAARRRVRDYSGGMKRRLAIAAAMLAEPELVLLDEPTAGVDPQSRAFILSRIAGLAEKGAAVVLSTHYMEEVEAVCERVAIMNAGRVIACGRREEIVASAGGHDLVTLAIRGNWTVGGLELGLLPFVHRFREVEGGVTLYVEDGTANIPVLIEHVLGRGVEIEAFSFSRRNLETVFLELTGRELRDS